ncbi:MAG: N-methylhydantoinase A, partial [Paracoccaceae bacterium]
EDAYRQENGATLGAIPVTLVGLTTAATAVRAKAEATAGAIVTVAEATPAARRPVHFGAWMDTPIYDRATLTPGMHFSGPAIIEQADTTSVIEPGLRAQVDAFLNILVEVA